MKKGSIGENVQKLIAFNPKKCCFEEMYISHNTLYKIVFENSDICYGWFDTSLDVLRKIHKDAGFKTLDQLLYLDYMIGDNFRVNKVDKIYDVKEDVKHIIPVEMRFFKSSMKDNNEIIEEIQCFNDATFVVNLSLPLYIKLHSGKTYRGSYTDFIVKGFVSKKKYIVISPLRISHPNNEYVNILLTDICDIYNIQVELSEYWNS